MPLHKLLTYITTSNLFTLYICGHHSTFGACQFTDPSILLPYHCLSPSSGQIACSRISVLLFFSQKILILYKLNYLLWKTQFSSVAQLCPTLYDPMDRSRPDLHVHHQLPELPQTHAHWVSDAIQPHPLSSPTPPAFNLSQHQGLFKGVSSLHQVAKVLEFQLQHQSFQQIFRTDFL